MKKKNIILSIAAVVLIAVVVVECCVGFGGNNSKTRSELKDDVVYLSQEEKFSTVENAQKYIVGTIWTHTTPGEFWIKLEFKNGKCYYYFTFPSAGEWGQPTKVYSYKVTEKRYNDTGKKYISIDLYDSGDEKSFSHLDPVGGQMKDILHGQITMEPHDYVWD